jgi:hypothetical protein
MLGSWKPPRRCVAFPLQHAPLVDVISSHLFAHFCPIPCSSSLRRLGCRGSIWTGERWFFLRPKSPPHPRSRCVACQRHSMPHPTLCDDATSAANVPSVFINMICTLSCSAPFLRLWRAVCARLGVEFHAVRAWPPKSKIFQNPSTHLSHPALHARSCVPFSFLLLLDRCHFQQVLYDRFCTFGRGVSVG